MNICDPVVEGVQVRQVQPHDQTQWMHLYRQYAHFYGVPMSDAILERTWSWLLDPMHPLEGLVAESAGQRLTGLAHFRACPEPLMAQEVGYLDDLFVLLDHRGLGIGQCLMMNIDAIARERGWPLVRWVTSDANTQARHLYDKLAQLTSWVTYDLDTQR